MTTAIVVLSAVVVVGLLGQWALDGLSVAIGTLGGALLGTALPMLIFGRFLVAGLCAASGAILLGVSEVVDSW